MWWWNVLANKLGSDVRGTLERCVQAKTPTVVLVYNPRCVYDGRFIGIGDSGLGIELFDLSPRDLPADTLCCVSFNLSGRSGVFLSTVTALELAPPRRPWLSLSLPDDLTLVDARQSYRVPVVANAPLEVTLHDGDRRWQPAPVNLSAGGMQVIFDALPHDLQLGTKVTVSLRLSDTQHTLDAFVVRQHGPSFGLAFSNEADSSSLDPLLAALETLWVEARHDS